MTFLAGRPYSLRSSSFACWRARLRAAGRFRPARFSKKVSIDIADLNGDALRRVLRSADRLSDSASARGLLVKTPRSRSSASLRSVTPRDQRFGFEDRARRDILLSGSVAGVGK